MAAVTVASGCGDGPGGIGEGTIRVTINGLGEDLTSAGTAVITGAGIDTITLQLPAVTSGEATVPAGTYHVVYTPPTGYVLAAGSEPEFDVTIVANEITEVEFTVQELGPDNGTVRVTVTGVAAGTANAGSAAILRTDIADQTPVNVDIPLSGTLDTVVVAGTYSVQYSAPEDHQLSAGQTNPQNLDVAEGETATATFQVEEVPAPPPVIFHSDWSTALGSSENAIRDGSKAVPWNITGGVGHEVISSAGLDFPSANVMRITAMAQTTGYAFLRRTGLAVPGAGESRFYRWYYRSACPDALPDEESHPIQDGNAASDCNWLFHVYHNEGGSGNWRPQLRVRTTPNPFPNDRWFGPVLSENATYRFELHLLRNAVSTFNLHVRIFNSSGTQIHGDSAFSNQQDSATLASTPNFGFHILGNLEGLNAGCNGIAGAAPFPFVYSYQGCFAISTVDWCGPYSNGI